MNENINENIIKKRIKDTQSLMAEAGVDVYVVFTGDYHMSEYTGDYFKEREFLSGFTGSAGELVISCNDAMLFTDGRYFVQAEKQLDGTGIKLMKSGTAGAVDIYEYCREIMPQKGVIGFDGKSVSAFVGKRLKEVADTKNGEINSSFNLCDALWTDRPDFPSSIPYVIESGESCENKLNRIRECMQKENCDTHIVASLDDICFIYNIRGGDVACNPVVMTYSIISLEEAYIYINEEKLSEEIIEHFKRNNVTIKGYEEFYKDLCSLRNCRVLIDKKRVNFYLEECLTKEESIIITNKMNPSVYMKAVKNSYEINNLKSVHIEDGLAVMRFMRWLKESKNKDEITEYQAGLYIDDCRREISDFTDLSFDTISAYGSNAAMLHYQADIDKSAFLSDEGMLLVDSGGQYLRGTTDVTRTYALGEVTEEMKKFYTLTLKGLFNLSSARFLKGCTGYNLDILARQPLWEQGVDYRCGTGHGVGYRLNVHESPNGFRWKHIIGVNDLCVLEPGMVTTDEPGVYIDGRFGIRLENELLCVEDFSNEYGTFLKFEHLTCAPFDLDLIDEKYLNELDKQRLNEYHMWVREMLEPLINEEEKAFLYESTRQL